MQAGAIIDYNTLFDQVQDFITGCSGEQVRVAPEMCKLHILS